MPIYAPNAPRPTIGPANTTVQDITSDFITVKDDLVALSQRASEADETNLEAQYRAALVLSSKMKRSVEKMLSTLNNLESSIRIERDTYKDKKKKTRSILMVSQPQYPTDKQAPLFGHSST
jgi:hypothetical protein